ncbi:MAG TPA: hypothetical protein VMT51_15310 [Dongiaceae bacterium]|nr:hypothetical protein [Dongiaceae bacterium]
MPTPSLITISLTAASAGAQLVVLLRWLHRRMRDDEVNRQFIRDIAHHHLPHIYEALHKIAAKQGILLSLPPSVHFMDFEEPDRGKPH